MNKTEKIAMKILTGRNDKSIPFQEMILLLHSLTFDERIKGSHHIFSKKGIEEIINIQPGDNNICKPYQVKQVRNLILKYKLGDFEDV